MTHLDISKLESGAIKPDPGEPAYVHVPIPRSSRGT